jgi:bifunctional non-homologous end joining protein LigD
LKSDKAIFDLKDINWLKPQLVARVRFLEKTSSGQLRHPSFVGLKEDENPRINFSTKNTEYKMVIEDQEITISNPDKIYFPEKKIRKIDLINYYLKISNHLLPFIVDRPQSLYRFPNGIYGDKFYQKNTDFKKKWIKTIKVKDTNYSVITNKASLAYIINLGCIEINPWLSKIPNIVKPDILAFDLDPGEEIGFNKVIDTALAIKNIFDQIGVKIFVKTSGASGLHIFVPLKPTSNYKASKLFAELIATLVQDKNDFVSLERDPNKRKDKVYIDFLQNNPGQTIASIYSIRPNNKALVSAPIAWKDLKKIKPDRFDIKTIFDQIEKNPWKDFFLTPYDISELYTKTKKLIKS